MTPAVQCTLAGVPPVQIPVEAARYPDVLSDGYVVSQDDRSRDKLRAVDCPIQMAITRPRVGDWTPELGEDSVELLTQAGHWAGEMRRLLDPGRVEQAATAARKGH
jgi:crotonobetainyl-CoA:carnitine CoA-transferase CaiB-like acyl-CoA transferase